MALVALLAAGGGYLVAMRLGEPPSPAALPAAAPVTTPVPTPVTTRAMPAPETLVGQRRPDFSLADAAGNPVAAADFDGHVLLLNFWATWCAPCVEEMPMLSRLQRNYSGRGLRVVGITVDDPVRARSFAEGLGLEYPVLFGPGMFGPGSFEAGLSGAGAAMLVGRRYGNASGMLPYSVLIDAAGIVRWTHLGAVTREQLETQLAELLL
jgi:peroxiredoxin